MRRSTLPLVLLAIVGFAPDAVAQMDREDEIQSLERVGDFGLVVDIESTVPRTVGGLDNAEWRKVLSARLTEVTGTAPKFKVDPTRDAHLYVHVNALIVGDQLVPFAVDVSFVQMADVGDGHRMMVLTWKSGLVGLVSTGELPLTLDAAVGVVDEFASDLIAARSVR